MPEHPIGPLRHTYPCLLSDDVTEIGPGYVVTLRDSFARTAAPQKGQDRRPDTAAGEIVPASALHRARSWEAAFLPARRWTREFRPPTDSTPCCLDPIFPRKNNVVRPSGFIKTGGQGD